MAVRYLAILAQDDHTRGLLTEAAQLKSCRYVTSTSFAWVATNTPILALSADRGLVVGDLFTRDATPRIVKGLDASDTQAVVSSCGGRLIDGYWGGYVAFLQDERGTIHVIRDPSATLPCYCIQKDGAHIFASDPALLVEIGFLSPQVDYAFLAHHLYAADIRTPRTGLIGLTELLAGFRMSITPTGHTVSPIWSPWDFTEWDCRSTDADIADHLGRVILGCVGAWAERYPTILLGVSGGLDSSIVAASLVAAGADLTCVTLATDEAEGDERAYARLLRDNLNIRLVEAMHRPEAVDFTTALSAYLPRPIGHAFGQSNYEIRFELERALNIDAFFSGIGGDNVFCYTQSATALVDRFRAEGIGRGLFETLADICRQNNASVGAVLRMALRRHFQKGNAFRFKGDRKFLSAAAGNLVAGPVDHPWLHAPQGALPGKATHVAMLTSLQGTIDGLPRDHAPQILPLISQPVMETCLAIPMWKWVANGRNRSVARAAFANRLPKALIDRQTKGGPTSFAYRLMEQHKALVRERLTSGRLAEHGLLDLPAIQAAMAPDRLIDPSDHMRLSDLAECEAWVRYWERGPAPLAKSGAARARESLPPRGSARTRQVGAE